jgi:sec-independent protein translocase protein TatB
MFNLDPGKLLAIAVVAIILLGPDKLPQFARQVGGAWRTFNDFRHRMESEVRSTMPDLPPTSEIARLARSPSALLTHLSNLSSEDEAPDGSFQPPASGANGTGEGAAEPVPAAVQPVQPVQPVGSEGPVGTADDGRETVGASGIVPGGGDDPATAPAPETNGRPAVAPQSAEVAAPADPTLN